MVRMADMEHPTVRTFVGDDEFAISFACLGSIGLSQFHASMAAFRVAPSAFLPMPFAFRIGIANPPDTGTRLSLDNARCLLSSQVVESIHAVSLIALDCCVAIHKKKLRPDYRSGVAQVATLPGRPGRAPTWRSSQNRSSPSAYIDVKRRLATFAIPKLSKRQSMGFLPLP